MNIYLYIYFICCVRVKWLTIVTMDRGTHFAISILRPILNTVPNERNIYSTTNAYNKIHSIIFASTPRVSCVCVCVVLGDRIVSLCLCCLGWCGTRVRWPIIADMICVLSPTYSECTPDSIECVDEITRTQTFTTLSSSDGTHTTFKFI